MDVLSVSKMFALLTFFPLFVGILVWTYWRGNRERLESYRLIPLEDDVREAR